MQAAFNDCPKAPRYWLAYSGGLDSHVLLDAAVNSQLKSKLQVVHIHHGLSPNADAWATHAAATCQSYGVALTIKHIQLKLQAGQSLEAYARKARYQAIAALMQVDEVLMTAHHQDDQAETFLLQALRGAGVSGLAAMPRLKRFGPGWHYRPLLDYSRQALESQAAGLKYITDESNYDIQHARNYLRHKIMPLIKAQWPAATQTLARSAGHASTSDTLVDASLATHFRAAYCSQKKALSIEKIQTHTRQTQMVLIRYWLKQANLDLPSTSMLERIVDEVMSARVDANPMLKVNSYTIRRYQAYLYTVGELVDIPKNWQSTWDMTAPLCLPKGMGELRPEQVPVLKQRVTVYLNTQGLKLKKRFQALKIPPWLRPMVPIISLPSGQIELLGDFVTSASP